MAVHAHEVLNMLIDNSFTEQALKKMVDEKFGKEALFYTCSASDMSIDQLITFLKHKGKVTILDDGQLTANVNRMCNH